MQYFKNANGTPILDAVVKAIQANKDYLSEIDGLIGDGDHGANMNKGFSIFSERHLGDAVGFTEGLNLLGTVLLEEIGGSMGPIYGTLFMEMSEAGDEEQNIDLAVFSGMLVAGLSGLQEIVDAKVGDKTLIDTLEPAVVALSSAEKDGKDFFEALKEAKLAAEKGQESTKDLVAKFGRSSRLGERSKGVLDAGATSCRIILDAMIDGIEKQIES